MSYGEVYIASDIRKIGVIKTAHNLHDYYTHIPLERALKIVRHVEKYGGSGPVNPHWKPTKKEIATEKRKHRAMKEFNLVEGIV